MFGGQSFDHGGQQFAAAGDLVDGWLARRADRVARRHALSATASSEAGRVSVTVGSDGAVTELILGEGIREQSAEATAKEILSTLQAARESLAVQADALAGARPPTS